MHSELGGCGWGNCANVLVGSEDIGGVSEEIGHRDYSTFGDCSKLRHRVLSHLF